MGKIWDVTIMKMGSMQVEAETEEEAIRKAEGTASSLIRIEWEDNWSAVDASDITKVL